MFVNLVACAKKHADNDDETVAISEKSMEQPSRMIARELEM